MEYKGTQRFEDMLKLKKLETEMHPTLLKIAKALEVLIDNKLLTFDESLKWVAKWEENEVTIIK